MMTDLFPIHKLANFLKKKKIAKLPELMNALGTNAKRTVFRKLKQLSYRTSYSHRGCFYTLDDIAKFDRLGLWSYCDVWFSLQGTLLSTAKAWVDTADSGYFVEELDTQLHVETKDVLRKLSRDGAILREPIGRRYLYCTQDSSIRKRQLLTRRAELATPGIAGSLPPPEMIADELKAAIILFYALLDEKQRRLYAGLESLKVGFGGDQFMSELLGLDPQTVARGRNDLLNQDVEVDRVRKKGGGRKSVEKKLQRSSSKSKP